LEVTPIEILHRKDKSKESIAITDVKDSKSRPLSLSLSFLTHKLSKHKVLTLVFFAALFATSVVLYFYAGIWNQSQGNHGKVSSRVTNSHTPPNNSYSIKESVLHNHIVRVVPVAIVTPDFFAVEPMLGRYFSPEEYIPNHQQVVILSYSCWEQFFESDLQVVGRTLMANKTPYTVVGVMPKTFNSPEGAEVYFPEGQLNNP
jgi:hypothetical protein